MKKAILLDRDGVINSLVYNRGETSKDSPLSANEFRLLPKVGEAIKRVNQMGFLAIVVSNQPGIAKGKFTQEALAALELLPRQGKAREFHQDLESQHTHPVQYQELEQKQSSSSVQQIIKSLLFSSCPSSNNSDNQKDDAGKD